jgi:hypothetical protein
MMLALSRALVVPKASSAAGPLVVVPGTVCGSATPDVKVGAGETRANLDLVGLGPDGGFFVYNSQGSVQRLVDVAGWYV